MFSTEITIWDYVQFASIVLMASVLLMCLIFHIEDNAGNYLLEDFIQWLKDLAQKIKDWALYLFGRQ